MSVETHMEKFEQYAAQGGRCWLCDEPLDMFLPSNTWGSCSWEHVIPRSCGGSNDERNLVLTHHECNKARGDRMDWHLRRPRTHAAMVEMQSPKRAQIVFDQMYRRLRGVMKRMNRTAL